MSTKEAKPLPKDFDLRVRDRNLASGRLDLKTIEQYLAALPDVSAQAEVVELAQPAFVQDFGSDDE